MMKQTAKLILTILAAATTAAASTFPLRQGYAGQVTGRVERARGDYAHCFTGTVTRVIDGDTIVVGTNIVRLAEIDAPEMKTLHGPSSRAALSDMILHKQVTVTWKRRGRYRRIIGHVYLANEWINLWLVEQGWATQFLRYSKCRQLAEAEGGARYQKVGLWQATRQSDLAVSAASAVQKRTRKR
jgi:endonuclease YncB( thermonuclease family)